MHVTSSAFAATALSRAPATTRLPHTARPPAAGFAIIALPSQSSLVAYGPQGGIACARPRFQSYVIDFGPLRRKEASIQDLAAGLTREDLARLTREMCSVQLAAIHDATDADVVMVPDDPDANDKYAANPEDVGLSWTLGHVVVHTTASSEESAALALVLARGLPIVERSRFEVPWEQARTAAFIRQRIDESLRMRLAMLAAWPDAPHLDNFYSPYEGRPPMNAVGRFLGGLAHDDSHLEQIRKIMGQARERRAAA